MCTCILYNYSRWKTCIFHYHMYIHGKYNIILYWGWEILVNHTGKSYIYFDKENLTNKLQSVYMPNTFLVYL